jgi:predicted transcriptional regulator
MPTTTIRLSDELKARVTAAAERAGVSPHSFIVDAIAARTEVEEQRRDLEEVAERRYAALVASGRSVPWSEMRRYLKARAAGIKAKPPAARKLAR